VSSPSARAGQKAPRLGGPTRGFLHARVGSMGGKYSAEWWEKFSALIQASGQRRIAANIARLPELLKRGEGA
jgi:hypothetical protein